MYKTMGFMQQNVKGSIMHFEATVNDILYN